MDVQEFSMRNRKLLMQRIQELGVTEHEEIFKLLSERNIEYTRNNNGIFINLSTIPSNVMHELSNFVTYFVDNNQILNKYDKMLCEINSNDASTLLPHPPSFPFPFPSTSTANSDEILKTDAADVAAILDSPCVPNKVVPVLIDKKIEHLRFTQAKKKYAKKRVPEKRGSDAMATASNLVHEKIRAN